jgi:predicted nuclease of restriction endonuclease-like (RecB) superfamily
MGNSYPDLVGSISELLEAARRASARTVNAFMTATYWEIGRRIVEFEQRGEKRAEYGKALLERLSKDLTLRYGRGFARPNLIRFRQFYLAFPTASIRSTLSNETPAALNPIRSTASNESNLGKNSQAATAELPVEICQTPSGISETPSQKFTLAELRDLARAFPLPWSHYVLLISRSRSPEAFAFYHAEALRGGWSVRQLRRQMDSQFYERTALSRNKAAMLARGAKPRPGDAVSADEEIRHPLILEFLGLRDEYSETDLEDALIRQIETFLLELGNDFAFIGRQRRLRCLVIFDLKLGRFTHADAGQMHLYLNYAREHWVQPGENPPVGIILCSSKSEALVRYATDSLPNKMLVREYLTVLPDEKTLANELEKTRKQLESRK